MSYDPVKDFLGLVRQTSGGMRTESMPGLDFVIAALARGGMISLSVGQTPPVVNQLTTVWFKPSNPSWVAEGVVFLWNLISGAYEPATPDLWQQLFSGAGNNPEVVQLVTDAVAVVDPDTTLLVVQRISPATTILTFPPVALRTKPLSVVDWSTVTVDHTINCLTPDGTTIMKLAIWPIFSNAVQLGANTFKPIVSNGINGWYVT